MSGRLVLLLVTKRWTTLRLDVYSEIMLCLVLFSPPFVFSEESKMGLA